MRERVLGCFVFFLKKSTCTGAIVLQELNHKTEHLDTVLSHNSNSAITRVCSWLFKYQSS